MAKGAYRRRCRIILERLREHFSLRREDFISWHVSRSSKDPFKTLIATILSQSSTDKGALKAYERLEERVGISPERIAEADQGILEEAIAITGLQRSKAKGIKALAQALLQHPGGLEGILRAKDARERLLNLPQVGPKTADVLLVTQGVARVLPVDTHINRVAKRLGLAPGGGGYEQVRGSLERCFDEESYHEAHLLLIAFGRKICKAQKPLCYSCPLEDLCPYPFKTPPPPPSSPGGPRDRSP